ncbi:MAG: tRNA pseudouridine(38-40) synthase TruA [Candidatus Izemoplasmatales bacterium]
MQLNLAEDCALKVDGNIFLNKVAVSEYLDNNQHLLEGINFIEHLDFHMKYGYNIDNNPIKIAYDSQGLVQRIIIKTRNYSNKRLMLNISYDGANYHGFQIQFEQKTIQGELSRLISTINNQDIIVQGASRTDAGVHAFNQVAHFDDASSISIEDWKKFLNYQLPKDIHVNRIEKMHPLFHSRYDVYKKEYIYKIKLGDYTPFLNKYTMHVEYLDFLRLDDQLKKIIGSHDFTSFSKGFKKDSIRNIYDAGYRIDNEILEIYISGNGFLRYMIRLIVNHVVNFATKKTDLDILDIIKEKSRKNTRDLAPANGLYLNKIIY